MKQKMFSTKEEPKDVLWNGLELVIQGQKEQEKMISFIPIWARNILTTFMNLFPWVLIGHTLTQQDCGQMKTLHNSFMEFYH